MAGHLAEVPPEEGRDSAMHLGPMVAKSPNIEISEAGREESSPSCYFAGKSTLAWLNPR